MNQNDDAGVREQIELIWRAKWFLLICAVICGGLAFGATFLMAKQYEATMTLSPVASTSTTGSLGSLGSSSSGIGGLAALAGISIGGDSSKAEAIAALQSESLTEKYIHDNGLLPTLYAKKWDAQRKGWKVMDQEDLPTLWKANRYFDSKVRKISTNAKSGLVTFAITWKDPILAAKWANGLVSMTNDYLRTKAISESERHIDYLNDEAGKTTMVAARQAIYSIMQTEINKSMIARGTEEYAFKVIDPAQVPELPSSPKKGLWVAAGAAIGLMLSMFWIFVRASWRVGA